MSSIKGKILDFISNTANVLTVDNKIISNVKVLGKLKSKDNKKLITGDEVTIEYKNNEPIISCILERKNELIRPKVANLDYVIIIQSVKEPNLDKRFINKLCMFYEFYIDNVILAFSKSDLLNRFEKEEFLKTKQDFISSGYDVFDLNEDNDFNDLKKFIKNKIVCLVGNSGVGKSSFINKINPKINLKVQEISKSLNRGKHTTTNSKIIKFDDYLIVDTPGYSSVELNFSNQNKAIAWNEFRKEAIKCKFNDCLHINEPGCRIIELKNQNKIKEFRYSDYLSFLNEK